MIGPNETSVLPLVMGLQPQEWLTLLGIIIGPIAAVIISLTVEARRRARDQKLQVFRILMTTRHLPADPSYSNSINLVPIEFDNNRKVLNAYNEYIEATRFKPQPGDEEKAEKLLIARQTKLIFEMATDLGFKLRESDLEIQAYAADSFVRREELQLNALRAWPEIAEALKLQTQIFIATNAPESDAESSSSSDSENSQ